MIRHRPDLCVMPHGRGQFTFQDSPHPIFAPGSFRVFLLPSFIPVSLQYKEMVYYGMLGEKVETFWDKISLTGCKWSNLDAPGSGTPLVSFIFQEFPFPIE